jgi:hypothetical protein
MTPTAKQLTLIPQLDTGKRSYALRQFANEDHHNILEQDERTLVLAAKSGDGDAFEILIERCQRRTLAVTRRFTRIREDAEDIVQLQRSLFSAQLTLAQDRGNEFQSLVQLYKALGGGWQQQ